MVHNPNSSGVLALRLIVGLALLGWPRVGSAQGTWSVISLPQWVNSLKPGEVFEPRALAVDAAGNLYFPSAGGIQKRDTQGNWSVIATRGASALAVDTAGNLWVAGATSGSGMLRATGP
jgi:hypothetical protein